jgi:hypothetical protein
MRQNGVRLGALIVETDHGGTLEDNSDPKSAGSSQEARSPEEVAERLHHMQESQGEM